MRKYLYNHIFYVLYELFAVSLYVSSFISCVNVVTVVTVGQCEVIRSTINSKTDPFTIPGGCACFYNYSILQINHQRELYGDVT